jgi:ABC-type transport system involved in cytochrome c biogenesis permease subunit
MQKALPLVPSLQSNWLMHIGMMMVSYATLILGSLLSILGFCFLVKAKGTTKQSSFRSSNGRLQAELRTEARELRARLKY